MKKLFFILLLISCGVHAQVVNIEQERIKNDTTGITGTGQLSFQYLKEKSEVFNIGAGVHLQHKTNKGLVLFITDYVLSKADGANYANAGIQHLRYNYKINNWLAPEVFTQAQFNEILHLNFRWLLGTGPRFTVVKNKSIKIYTGLSYMYEYEEVVNAVYHRDHRLSSYLSLSYKLGENASIVNTTYYQPLFSNATDYRISSQTDMKIQFAKHFAFKVGYVYFIDTKPAEDVPRETQNFRNTISFSF
jgi:hypothetical protein